MLTVVDDTDLVTVAIRDSAQAEGVVDCVCFRKEAYYPIVVRDSEPVLGMVQAGAARKLKGGADRWQRDRRRVVGGVPQSQRCAANFDASAVRVGPAESKPDIAISTCSVVLTQQFELQRPGYEEINVGERKNTPRRKVDWVSSSRTGPAVGPRTLTCSVATAA